MPGRAAAARFAVINAHGLREAQLHADRLASDARQRRRLVQNELLENDGSEEARFVRALEQGKAAGARLAGSSSPAELRLALVDIALVLSFSRRAAEVIGAAAQLLGVLDAEPLARRELLALAHAEPARAEAIDAPAMLANAIATLLGVCARVRDSGAGKKDSQLDTFLLAMRLASDLRLALLPAVESARPRRRNASAEPGLELAAVGAPNGARALRQASLLPGGVGGGGSASGGAGLFAAAPAVPDARLPSVA